MTTTIFLCGWLCGAPTIALWRYAVASNAFHVPAAERLLKGERFPLGLTHTKER